MAKLLIVEDNPFNRDMLARRLEKRGFALCYAETGEIALEVAVSERPDLVLMDIGMGAGIDGLETTRRLKAMPATAAIPVIALTAHALASDRERSTSSRMFGLRYQAGRHAPAAGEDRSLAACDRKLVGSDGGAALAGGRQHVAQGEQRDRLLQHTRDVQPGCGRSQALRGRRTGYGR